MSFLRTLSHRYLLILCAGFLLILAADHLGFTEGMNQYCYDLFFRLRGTVEPDRRILIVAIDDRTLKRLGRWPLRRLHYARLLDAMGAAPVVGIDVLMAEPSGDDQLLADAIARHGRVVLPVSLEHPSPLPSPSGSGTLPRGGHVYLEPDLDGVVRRVYHTLYHGGRAVPSFSSRLYDLLEGAKMHRLRPGESSEGGLLQGDGRVINYCGPPGTFPHISMVDILDGRYPPPFFTNRIVLVGVTADGLEGKVLTPFSQLRSAMAGVELHATLLNNLLNHSSIVPTPEPVMVVVSLCASLAGFLLLVMWRGRRMLLWWWGGTAGIWVVSFVLFAWLDIWFSPILLSLLLLLLLVCAQVNSLEEGARELEKARDDWEQSFDTIDDAIVLTGADGAVARMNRSARELQAPRLLELLPPDAGNGASTGGNGEGGFRELADPLTGKSFEVSSRARSGQAGAGCVHVMRDVTARKKMEEEKEQLRFQFLQAQKMESVGRLAGGVAHDFNNILTAILGYCEIAQVRAAQDEQLAGYLEVIHDSGKKAASLVRQLLAFSRKSSVEPQVVDLRSVVASMAKILGRVIGEDIILTLETETPVRNIFVDPAQVEQIIMNLVVNARDAMPQGGTVTIRTEDVELDSSYTRSHLDLAPGPYVMLLVRDSGTGMSQEVRERIFEPFFTTKKVGEGTGLGLSTVYGIVRQMAGHIYVYSEPGRGSVFKVYFPVSQESVSEAEQQESEALPGGSETLLVVEDDPSILDLLTPLLEPLGYTVLAARSGAEALDLVEQRGVPVDLLLTDVIMPGMGGKELAEQFLQRYPEARVVFMSGYTDEVIMRQGVAQERCIYIQKPLLPHSLVRKLRQALDA